ATDPAEGGVDAGGTAQDRGPGVGDTRAAGVVEMRYQLDTGELGAGVGVVGAGPDRVGQAGGVGQHQPVDPEVDQPAGEVEHGPLVDVADERAAVGGGYRDDHPQPAGVRALHHVGEGGQVLGVG